MNLRYLYFSLFYFASFLGFSQSSIDQILEAGIGNAEQFSEAYFQPAAESLIASLSNAWYNTAEVKKLYHFEIGFVANASFVREDKKTFYLNTAEYTGLAFKEGPSRQLVSTVFGENDPDIILVVNPETPDAFEINLPDGIGETGINFIPTAFLQASVGLPKSTELKLRFLPNLGFGEDASLQLFGVGVQHEFSDWIFRLKRWPVRLSAVIGFTSFKGSFDLKENEGLAGADQSITSNSNSWLFTSVVSTKLPIINFYTGIGFFSGSSETKVLGTYELTNTNSANLTITDPVRISASESGLRATLGAYLKLAFFRLNLDYTLQNYNTLSLGMQFGW